MERSALLVCQYGSANAAVRIEDTMGYDEVVEKISEKLNDLNPKMMSLMYSIPGYSNLKIENSDDVSNLFFLLRSNSSGRVARVVVGCCSPMHLDDGCVGSMSTVTESSDKDLNDDVEDLLLTFYAQPEKVLLSDRWKDAIQTEGQKFEGGVKEFRTVLAKYAVQRGFSYNYVRNDKTRVTVECRMKEKTGCKWYIRGREMLGSGVFYIVKLVNVHSRGIVVRTGQKSRIGSEIVRDIVFPDVGEKPLTRPVDVVKKMKKDYGVDISYRVAWVGVEKARGSLFRDNASQFDELRWYVETARRSNPNSVLDLEVDVTTGRFKRLFVSFFGCINGFQFCKPLLFLDATFLKGRYKGMLLAATAKDGNQGLFPLAFAIVDAENDENWHWFLKELKKVVGGNRILAFVSDRQKGLLEAVPAVFPNAHHAFCLNHLKANLRDKLSGVPSCVKINVVKLFSKAAYAPTAAFFEEIMDKLRRFGGNRLQDFLDELPPKHWANAYFRGRRYSEMTSNAAESFNAWILEARHLPIVGLVDRIRLQLMTQMCNRRAEAEKWNGKICPVMDERLMKYLDDGKSWDVVSANDKVVEIRAVDTFYVNIDRKLCSCHQWQLNGFPCEHAVVALYGTGRDVYKYVDEFFHVGCYKEAYKGSILPVPSSERKDVDNSVGEIIKPPITKKQLGRDKKRREPSRGEKTKQIMCGRCKKFGNHNRKTCKVSISE